MKYETRIMKVMVAPEKASIFDETATFVEITDEAGGEFVKISQHNEQAENGTIAIEGDWEEIKRAVDDMMDEIKFAEANRAGLNE